MMKIPVLCEGTCSKCKSRNAYVAATGDPEFSLAHICDLETTESTLEIYLRLKYITYEGISLLGLRALLEASSKC